MRSMGFAVALLSFAALFADGAKCPDAKDVLKKHNAYRKLHGAKPLKWSKQMERQASAAAGRCVFQHTPLAVADVYGENLAGDTSGGCSRAVTTWYNEKIYYEGDFSPKSWHFSQVVWKGTTKIGCGWNTCKGKLPYSLVVCYYSAPGNMAGEFPENVQLL